MKSYSIIHILLFIILMIAYQCSHAQDMLVKPNGDTLRGSVKMLTYGLEKKVQLTPSGEKKQTFSIVEIKSFTYQDEVYQPMRGPNGYTFMKLKTPGYLSVFLYQPKDQPIYNGLFLYKKTGEGIEVPNLSFKKVMTKFLNDCPEVVAALEAGTYGRNDLDQIVSEYNGCIEKRTVNHAADIARRNETSKKISPWDELEQGVKELNSDNKYASTLEMISEIKNKISRGEKIPNFLIEGLKSSLAPTDLTDELTAALEEIK